jgi:hypothetical protein
MIAQQPPRTEERRERVKVTTQLRTAKRLNPLGEPVQASELVVAELPTGNLRFSHSTSGKLVGLAIHESEPVPLAARSSKAMPREHQEWLPGFPEMA